MCKNSFPHFLLAFVFSFLASSFQLYSQSTDSLNQKKKVANDSVLLQKHSPKKALIFSAIIPGLGQAYNKKYWKIPVIYAGFAGFGAALINAQDKYVRYRDAFIYRIDGDSSTVDEFEDEYSDENLNSLQSHYHRSRDLFIISISALYVLNIIDAAVDAHLFYFDVSDQLSLKIRPYIENPIQAGYSAKGVTLTLKF